MKSSSPSSESSGKGRSGSISAEGLSNDPLNDGMDRCARTGGPLLDAMPPLEHAATEEPEGKATHDGLPEGGPSLRLDILRKEKNNIVTNIIIMITTDMIIVFMPSCLYFLEHTFLY